MNCNKISHPHLVRVSFLMSLGLRHCPEPPEETLSNPQKPKINPVLNKGHLPHHLQEYFFSPARLYSLQIFSRLLSRETETPPSLILADQLFSIKAKTIRLIVGKNSTWAY